MEQTSALKREVAATPSAQPTARSSLCMESGEGWNLVPLSDHDKRISSILEEIAKRKDSELLQVTLAYMQQEVPYVSLLVGEREVSHLKGSIGGLSVSFTEEIEKIENAYTSDHGFLPTFLSGTMFSVDAKPKTANGPADVSFTNAQSGDAKFDWIEDSKATRLPQ